MPRAARFRILSTPALSWVGWLPTTTTDHQPPHHRPPTTTSRAGVESVRNRVAPGSSFSYSFNARAVVGRLVANHHRPPTTDHANHRPTAWALKLWVVWLPTTNHHQPPTTTTNHHQPPTTNQPSGRRTRVAPGSSCSHSSSARAVVGWPVAEHQPPPTTRPPTTDHHRQPPVTNHRPPPTTQPPTTNHQPPINRSRFCTSHSRVCASRSRVSTHAS